MTIQYSLAPHKSQPASKGLETSCNLQIHPARSKAAERYLISKFRNLPASSWIFNMTLQSKISMLLKKPISAITYLPAFIIFPFWPLTGSKEKSSHLSLQPPRYLTFPNLDHTALPLQVSSTHLIV